MTILESIADFGRTNHMASAKRQHLLLAYLMLHMENPGLHPDDMYGDGGYPGYGVLLVDAVNGTYSTNPDAFTYPTSFLKLLETLEELQGFHQDLVEDEGDEYNLDLLASVNDIEFWLEDMKPSELDGIVRDLQKLYLYHACESDSAEEEAEKPAGVLKDCADVLNWVLMQH